MNQQIRITETGQPSVMRLEAAPAIGRPGRGQVHLRHEAIGVNFVDTLFRSGAFNVALPLAMGVEGAGDVLAVGEGMTNVQPGDTSAFQYGHKQPGSHQSAPLKPGQTNGVWSFGS